MAEQKRPQPPDAVTGTKGITPAESPLTPTQGAPNEPAPVVVDVDTPIGIRNLPLAVLAVIAVILLLQFASAVFIPVAVAILISYALSPPVTSLQRHGIPPAVGAGIVLTLIVTLLGLGVYTLTDQVSQIVDQVPVAAKRIRGRMQQPHGISGGVVEKVQRAAQEVDRTASEAGPDPTRVAGAEKGVQKVEVVQPAFSLSNYLWSGGMTILGFVGQAVLVLFLVYFFLVTGDLYKRKLVKIAGPTFSEKKLTVQILDEINRQIENFMIRIWKDHPVLRRRKFFQGRRIRGAEVIDIAWLDSSGAEMTDDIWHSPDVRTLGVRLNGDAIQEVDERGRRISGDTLLLLLNAGDYATAFVLPPTAPIERWDTLIDTADPWQPSRRLRAGDRYALRGRSMAVLRLNNRKDDLRRAADWGPQGVL